MRKVLLYLLIIILLCFILPVIFTKRFNTVETMSSIVDDIKEENKIEEVKIADYDYSNYTNVKLLHTSTNEIEEVNLDEYLCNVVAAEMPVDYDIEALKAHAIAARNYTIYKIINKQAI